MSVYGLAGLALLAARIVRQAFVAHGGEVVDTQGAAFFMGVHRTQRIMAAGHGGQVRIASVHDHHLRVGRLASFSDRANATRLWRAAVVLVAAALLLPLLASAAGGLDPTFGGGGGEVVTDFGLNDWAADVAVQSNGKIVAVGTTHNTLTGKMQFALARYTGSGALDHSFGTGGRVRTSFGGPRSVANALAVAFQGDGKVVVAGNAMPDGGASYFALARYNANGRLDRSFGVDGKVLTGFGAAMSEDGALGLAVQSDGKLVVAGHADDAATGRAVFALVRCNPDGSLDASFGGDGKVVTAFTSHPQDGAVSVALAPGRRIVAAGFGVDGIEVARYNSDGSLDTSFGGDGRVLGPKGWLASSAVVQPDGKVVIAGSIGWQGGGTRLGVVRYDGDGRLDSTFGSGGVSSPRFYRRQFAATAVALQPDGKLVVAGDSFLVARLDSAGTLDRTFNGTGWISTRFGTNTSDEAAAVALQPNGRVIVAGSSRAPADENDFALARYVARLPPCRVPNVRGQTLADAEKRLRAAHCSVGGVRSSWSKTTKGHVISQSPAPAMTLPNAGTVNLVVSRGPLR